jgi:glycosyltransferase involved in cell wall biosynthesis
MTLVGQTSLIAMKNYSQVLMKILLITEKCSPHDTQRDGGARLVETMKRAFGDSLNIMQFGSQIAAIANWHFEYPVNVTNRFERRIANGEFIAKQVKAVAKDFTHIIFVHISMQFGLVDSPLPTNIEVWTFPMFLTPSYIASGERVPEEYQSLERLALLNSRNILTPSHLEKRQLIDYYSIPQEQIHVVPRGVDTKFLKPKIRAEQTTLKFCSIGSIKPQKNILGLVRLFGRIYTKFPGATLKIIGPFQDPGYYENVCTEIQNLKLDKFIEFTGHIQPNELALAVEDAHMHLSTSSCETFGRAIFETLASGLPNVVSAKDNAAAEFLKDLPYIHFFDDDQQAINAIEDILANLSKLSAMALEIGKLYDDVMLSKLLVAKISNKNSLGVSDFDGTLFHKNDHVKTLQCVNAFKKFPLRVVCSARPIDDLLDKLKAYNLNVDWIISYSGAVVANGKGELLWVTHLDEKDITALEMLVPEVRRIKIDGQTLQLTAPAKLFTKTFGLRTEVYQGIAFISHWEASKLRAVHRLLNYIDWSGQVQVFGDGIYDSELITYFDGDFITASTYINHRTRENIRC